MIPFSQDRNSRGQSQMDESGMRFSLELDGSRGHSMSIGEGGAKSIFKNHSFCAFPTVKRTKCAHFWKMQKSKIWEFGGGET
jgi:hypothetical protein